MGIHTFKTKTYYEFEENFISRTEANVKIPFSDSVQGALGP